MLTCAPQAEALKRELYSITEEKDKLQRRLQAIEKEMADCTVSVCACERVFMLITCWLEA